jgi:hypothetical protein
LVLVLSACSPAPAVVGSEPESSQPQVEPTQQPTEAVGANLGAATSTQTLVDTPAAMMNAVQVNDQALVNDTVTVALVTSTGPGWLVIHADNGGKPGAVIGHSQVRAGDNQDVLVQIDLSQATPMLFAMLHTDAGVLGTYEFPGTDVPAMDSNSQMVTPAFAVTGGLNSNNNANANENGNANANSNANDNSNGNANGNSNGNSNNNGNGNDDGSKPDY